MSYHFDPNILVTKDKPYYWHKYVIEDEDFISRAAKLKTEINNNFDITKLFNYDPVLLRQDGLAPQFIEMFNSLAAEFRITRTFLTRYLDGYYPDLISLQSAFAVPVRCGYEDSWIALRMGKNVTQEQFRQLWPMVELTIQLKAELFNRHRDIRANMHLVYCIQRALDSGIDFDKIASLYTLNKLSGYDSANDDIRTPKWLKAYYKRHSFLSN